MRGRREVTQTYFSLGGNCGRARKSSYYISQKIDIFITIEARRADQLLKLVIY